MRFEVMRRIGAALGALAVVIGGTTTAHAWNACGTFGVDLSHSEISRDVPCLCHDTTSTGASPQISIRGVTSLRVLVDPDVTSTGTGCEVQAYECTQASVASCTKLLGDTDGDGVVNVMTLDGATLMRRGVDGFRARWLYLNVTANPSSHSCRTMVCGF